MKFYPLAKPEINDDDIEAVTQVLQSQHLSRGPVVKEFEQEFCKIMQCRHASAVSSGTAGLIIALQALGVQKSDEVITVSFTVPATVNSIVAVGAKPIMVDIETDTLGMCPEALNAAISPKTKAIIVVHAFGKAAKIKELMRIANTHNIKVIEDACEAIGNSYENKPLGTFADVGVFAFYPNKQITTGEGGMLITNDQSLFSSFELLKNHGRSMNGDLYDQMCFGWNFRLSDINAALGLSQLKRLKTIVAHRKKLSDIYDSQLKNNTSIIHPEFSTHENQSAWFVYVVQLVDQDRNKVMELMLENGIACGRYFAPVHLQPYYLKLDSDIQLKNTQNIASQCLALPFYPGLNNKDIELICNILLKITN